jgi:hypothetical protein
VTAIGEAISEGTGDSRSGNADREGHDILLNLPASTYDVRATHDGFTPNTLSRLVQLDEIDELPVITGNFNDLPALAPGVTRTGVYGRGRITATQFGNPTTSASKRDPQLRFPVDFS